mgnify:CR=1 FL=1
MTLLDDEHQHDAPHPHRLDPLLARTHERVITAEYPVVGSAPEQSRFDSTPRPGGTGTVQLIASVVVPGAGSWSRHRVAATMLALAGVVVPVLLVAYVFVERARLVGLALDPRFLLGVMVVGLLAVASRIVAIGEVAYAFRRSPGMAFRAAVALAVTGALSLPVLSVVSDAAGARDAVSDVFGSDSGEPLFVPPTGGGAVADQVTHVLVMGGDAGPGRWGMRTDTMMLISVHDASGRMALTSIPRNLTALRFPPGSPLAAEFPNGFDDLANALFTHVNSSPVLVDHYGQSGQQPEAMALVEAVGYSLDVQIDDYALVNMQGFTEVIDAVGGVTLELGQRVPLPPSLPGERALPAEIGPGMVEMDGAMAIAYARSRSADSDYQRMGRQRQLLAALGTQVSPTAAAGAFGTVTGALDDSMRTSLSAQEFDTLLDRLGDNSAITESVGLAPPLVTPGSPDYAEIAVIVAGVQQALIDGARSGYAGG